MTGNAISKIRRTLQGSLLIEVSGGAEVAKKVKQEVVRSLVQDARVRKMGEEAPIEIRDLDELTAKEEVLEVVARAPEGSPRRVYRDAQTAVVLLPTPTARRLCVSGRVRVSLVSASVQQTELRPRCYRCLGFGHLSKDCRGRDRSNVC